MGTVQLSVNEPIRIRRNISDLFIMLTCLMNASSAHSEYSNVLSFLLSELFYSLSSVLSDVFAAVNSSSVPLVTDALMRALQSTVEATLQVWPTFLSQS